MHLLQRVRKLCVGPPGFPEQRGATHHRGVGTISATGLPMIGELSPQQVERVLHAEVTGRIGCYAEGRVYVVPITYAYDQDAVYAHSSDGLKIRTMRANPNVCFEVEQVDDLAHWRSVVAWGTYEELSGASEDQGLEILLQRFAPLRTSETASPRAHGHRADGVSGRPIVFRIRLNEKTGRFEKR